MIIFNIQLDKKKRPNKKYDKTIELINNYECLNKNYEKIKCPVKLIYGDWIDQQILFNMMDIREALINSIGP